MLDKITPGSKITLKIVKSPTSAAATKTIVRLLAKDTTARKEDARLKKARKANFRQNRRGGRFWDVNVVKQQPLEAKVGVVGTLVASLDVLTDLRSVARFVEVTRV